MMQKLADWIVEIGSDKDGDLIIRAIGTDPDLPDVDALEHRFLLANPDTHAGGATAILFVTTMHRCRGASGDCESFLARDEETSLEDVDDALLNAIRDFGFSLTPASEFLEEEEFDDEASVEIEIGGPEGE